MCGFALSRDAFRFGLSDFEELLPQATRLGVGYVRFTGGEPLLHKDIMKLVRCGSDAGMRMSIITNGTLLPKMIDELADAGLAQVIVSIDGDSAETQDSYRQLPGLFDQCMHGLQMARERSVRTRVNTVVGPHNYEQMPRLQKTLTDAGVQQWELSAIKLERRIVYPDPLHVQTVCDPLYNADPHETIVPMGKRFYGDTEEERARFFDSGITPRPGPPRCHLVGDVIYIDAKMRRGYGCSLLPHRNDAESGGGVLLKTDAGWSLDNPEFRRHVAHFRDAGPTMCRSCSTTAAGYSDDVAGEAVIGSWHF